MSLLRSYSSYRRLSLPRIYFHLPVLAERKSGSGKRMGMPSASPSDAPKRAAPTARVLSCMAGAASLAFRLKNLIWMYLRKCSPGKSIWLKIKQYRRHPRNAPPSP